MYLAQTKDGVATYQPAFLYLTKAYREGPSLTRNKALMRAIRAIGSKSIPTGRKVLPRYIASVIEQDEKEKPDIMPSTTRIKLVVKRIELK
jgi:hypothetical protein